MGLLGRLVEKPLEDYAGALGLIPGWGRSPGEGSSSPLQCSGLENSVDCTVHGVAELGTPGRPCVLSSWPVGLKLLLRPGAGPSPESHRAGRATSHGVSAGLCHQGSVSHAGLHTHFPDATWTSEPTRLRGGLGEGLWEAGFSFG